MGKQQKPTPMQEFKEVDGYTYSRVSDLVHKHKIPLSFTDKSGRTSMIDIGRDPDDADLPYDEREEL